MTSHTQYAQRLFGTHPAQPIPNFLLPSPGPGELYLLLGPSGCGKTQSLQRMQGARLRPLPDAANALDCFAANLPHDQVLKLLARVGLADATLWARPINTLSAGEQRRLQLALVLAGAGELPLLIDEPDAHLDLSTATVIAQLLRKHASNGLVVATHRPELTPYFAPDRVFELTDSGLSEQIIPARKQLADELTFREGRKRDYKLFSRWHYLGGGLGPVDRVFIAELQGQPVAIAVLGFPHLHLKCREQALPMLCHSKSIKSNGAKYLNANVRLLQRIVVHPRYRGAGFAVRLLRHCLPNLGAKYVECLAQMGPFSGFLASSGFRHVSELQPPDTVKRLRDYLRLNNVKPEDLLSDNLPEAAIKLLRTFADRRAQTGHGAARHHGQLSNSCLGRALQRLHAQPSYYLWTQS